MLSDIDHHKRLVTFVALTLLGLIVVRTAWVSDDAYITFRTIDNFFHGYGLRWNIAERVQAYTHPLWMLVIGSAYGVTREPYFTSLAISLVLTLYAMFLLLNKLSTGIPSAVAAWMILVLSTAFIDYSTSGLENPLTHFLLIVFFVVYFDVWSTPRRVLVLAGTTALLAMNHPDTVLLVLPALAVAVSRERARSALLALALGFIPLALWEGFSLVYYGFPLPNTAYAKLLRTGVPASELVPQGLIYLLDSLNRDPITLGAVAGASAFAIVSRMTDVFPILYGIAMYLAYVLRIGGDFMSGRLLSPPLLCAAVIVSRVDTSRFDKRIAAFVYIAIAAVGLSSQRPTVFRDDGAATPATAIAPSGIADERMVYFPETGLVNVTRAKGTAGGRVKNPAPEGLVAPGPDIRVELLAAVGFHGYYAGPGVHVIDQLGLADPLLARMPAAPNSRIGHFFRGLPEGYLETVRTGVNHLRDEGLIEYYNRLSIITREPLFSRRRLRTIIRMNLGSYDSLLAPSSS